MVLSLISRCFGCERPEQRKPIQQKPAQKSKTAISLLKRLQGQSERLNGHIFSFLSYNDIVKLPLISKALVQYDTRTIWQYMINDLALHHWKSSSVDAGGKQASNERRDRLQLYCRVQKVVLEMKSIFLSEAEGHIFDQFKSIKKMLTKQVDVINSHLFTFEDVQSHNALALNLDLTNQEALRKHPLVISGRVAAYGSADLVQMWTRAGVKPGIELCALAIRVFKCKKPEDFEPIKQLVRYSKNTNNLFGLTSTVIPAAFMALVPAGMSQVDFVTRMFVRILFSWYAKLPIPSATDDIKIQLNQFIDCLLECHKEQINKSNLPHFQEIIALGKKLIDFFCVRWPTEDQIKEKLAPIVKDAVKQIFPIQNAPQNQHIQNLFFAAIDADVRIPEADEFLEKILIETGWKQFVDEHEKLLTFWNATYPKISPPSLRSEVTAYRKLQGELDRCNKLHEKRMQKLGI